MPPAERLSILRRPLVFRQHREQVGVEIRVVGRPEFVGALLGSEDKKRAGTDGCQRSGDLGSGPNVLQRYGKPLPQGIREFQDPLLDQQPRHGKKAVGEPAGEAERQYPAGEQCPPTRAVVQRVEPQQYAGSKVNYRQNGYHLGDQFTGFTDGLELGALVGVHGSGGR